MSAIFIENIGNYDVTDYACVIVDEAQFLTKAQVEHLVHIVDDLGVPVVAYGLRTGLPRRVFRGQPVADGLGGYHRGSENRVLVREKATYTTRIYNGKVIKEGEQILLGGNESYTSLCRKHWTEGNLGDR